ncbi:MAG: class I SAM-dependent methyltransferase [Planctomycetota bacterium]
MQNQPAAPTTFERSCRHWSEQSAGEMAAFYRLASYDYTLLAGALDWAAELERVSQSTADPTLSLLDVACGSGKFPAALLADARFARYAGKPIDYHLLDPSEFSLDQAAGELRPPFCPGQKLHCTLQQLTTPPRHDVVWATHALYCVPAEELGEAARRFCAALRPGGVGFIAHAAEDSHYLTFQRLYLQHWPGASGAPFCTAAQVSAALQQAAAQAFESGMRFDESTLDYGGTLPLEDTATAEMYLQRCLFDDGVTLDQMLAGDHLGGYLRGRRDEAAGLWRFPQQTKLMRIEAVA